MAAASPVLLAGLALVVAPTFAGAQDPAPPAASRPDTVPAVNYLPYGVPVPVGTVLDAVPQPHDPVRHGPPVPNTQPEANLVGKPGTPAAPEEAAGLRKGPRLPADPPPLLDGDGDYAIFIQNSTGLTGAHDVQTDLVIPDNAVGSFVYAPTSLPGGNACFEATARHYRTSTSSVTQHESSFYNHCGLTSDGYVVREYMNSTWKQKYARIHDGEERYWFSIYKDGSGCWIGELYNFALGKWEAKTDRICRSSEYDHGWTAWESWYLKVCPAFPSIRASSLQVLANGSWTPLGTAHTYTTGSGALGPCWSGGTYTFHIHQANHDWHAHTPNP